MQICRDAKETRKRPDQLETQLCFAVYSAAHAFTRAYKPLLDPLGLTYPQYLVMLVLWEEDGQTVRVLGDRLGLDSGTLSPLLKRLEQAGLVIRIRNKRDERQVLISLTAKGREMQGDAARVNTAIAAATGCSQAKAESLRDGLLALTDRLTNQPAE